MDASQLATAADVACRRLIEYLWPLQGEAFLKAFEGLAGMDLWDEHAAALTELDQRYAELSQQAKRGGAS